MCPPASSSVSGRPRGRTSWGLCLRCHSGPDVGGWLSCQPSALCWNRGRRPFSVEGETETSWLCGPSIPRRSHSLCRGGRRREADGAPDRAERSCTCRHGQWAHVARGLCPGRGRTVLGVCVVFPGSVLSRQQRAGGRQPLRGARSGKHLCGAWKMPAGRGGQVCPPRAVRGAGHLAVMRFPNGAPKSTGPCSCSQGPRPESQSGPPKQRLPQGTPWLTL